MPETAVCLTTNLVREGPAAATNEYESARCGKFKFSDMGKSKKYTLFFSWQSDEKKSRQILETALLAAKEELEKKEGITIEIDHSTLGETGMQYIDQVILRKIDNCDLFLADLTPVDQYTQLSSNGLQVTKEVPNSNVLLELGYAMSALGVDYVIPVAHKGKWLPQNLPFDINHRKLYSFDSSECDLADVILPYIKYIRKHGGHRHLDKPYFVYWINREFNQLFPPKVTKPQKSIIYEESTVFFRRRMAAAFPGERGLVEYSKASDIHLHLSKLLEAPLKYDECLRGTPDPVWFFRGGSALDISLYKRIGWRRFVLGWDELNIRRIVAFIDNGRYYSNYVYVEAGAQKPTRVNRKHYSKDHIRELKDSLGDVVGEEYAIYKPCALYRKMVTKQEEDDGATRVLGRLVHMKREHVETRVRYLTDYNFIIAAKGSAFNCDEFNRTSKEYFNGLLDGTVKMEDFHKYMMMFPKPDWDF